MLLFKNVFVLLLYLKQTIFEDSII